MVLAIGKGMKVKFWPAVLVLTSALLVEFSGEAPAEGAVGVTNSSRLIIQTAGDYLVAVTIPMSTGVQRSAVRAEVTVNGTPVDGAIGESSSKNYLAGA